MRPLTTILILCLLGCQPVPQTESPSEVVRRFGECHGTACMDSVAGLTTAAFRKDRPESVWVVETWNALNKIGYRVVSSEPESRKIRGNRAVVVLRTRIGTVGGDADQREVYFLIRENGRWKIDDMKITDEIVDADKMML